jgi:urease accessory protein UreF
MKTSRAGYRVRQFWQALWAKPRTEQIEQARQLLNPAQFELFQQLQLSEQTHALDVCSQLRAQGETDPDLLAAALLHDVGKVRYPLRVWDRMAIVLANKFLSKLAEQWGQAEPGGWKRPFVVAAQHPTWGADLAAERDVSPKAAALIRHHQDKTVEGLSQEEKRLITILQTVDDNN